MRIAVEFSEEIFGDIKISGRYPDYAKTGMDWLKVSITVRQESSDETDTFYVSCVWGFAYKGNGMWSYGIPDLDAVSVCYRAYDEESTVTEHHVALSVYHAVVAFYNPFWGSGVPEQGFDPPSVDRLNSARKVALVEEMGRVNQETAKLAKAMDA